MENNYVIGIDLGLSGAMSLLSDDKRLVECIPVQTIEVVVNKKIRSQYDIQAVYSQLMIWNKTFNISRAGMEKLTAIPNQSSQTGFSMGGSSMLFKTIFTILNIPFIEFAPQKWQKKIFGDIGIQYRIPGATKNERKKAIKMASVQSAKQLFPEESFLATNRSRVPSHDMADSALISLYVLLGAKNML